MGRIVFDTATTINGWIADEQNSLSWLFAVPGGEEPAEGLLPDPDLRIVIEPQGSETTPDGSSAPRTATLHACTTLGLELLP